MKRTTEQEAVKYRQIVLTEGQCGAWWKSLNHFDYLHRCTLDMGHDGACTCACGAPPGPRGVMKRSQVNGGA